jgi:site-specific DNA-methyltransferase (adenine-specific)
MRKGTRTSSFGTNGRINHDSSSFYNSKMYQKVAIKTVTDVEEIDFPKDYENKIILGSSEKMTELPNSCVHLMITSPPYNVTKEYDNNLSLDEYLHLLSKCFSETYRVLVNGGRACINIANVGRKPYIPFSDYISKMMIDMGFNMRGEIIWNKGSSAGVSMAWGSWTSASNPILRDVHEYILIFSKGSYRRCSSQMENTITKEQFMEWTKSVWTMSAESARKVGHPAPFPEELPRRLIHLYSFKNDVVLDPFMGSGTTAVAALNTGRRYVGYDNNPEYVKLAEKRLSAIKRQSIFSFSDCPRRKEHLQTNIKSG